MAQGRKQRTASSTILRMTPIILGLLGTVAAFALAAIAGQFLQWHYALGGLSIASILGGLLWLQDVKWKIAISTLVYTIFFIVCVGLVYLISANRPGRFDITQNKMHTLSPQTQNLLANLPSDQSILIQAFYPLAEHLTIQRFLNNYARFAPQIDYELYDPARDIGQMTDTEVRIQPGDVILTLRNQQDEVVRQEVAQLGDQDMKREHLLSNAIARLIHTEEGVVYFLQGHGEKKLDDSDEGFSKLAEQISAMAYPVEPLRLLQEQAVPQDAMAIVIAGPAFDVFDPEREMLMQYLEEGGKLVLLLDPHVEGETKFPNIEELLANTGVRAPNRLIVDPISVNASNSSFTPVVRVTDHAIGEASNQKPFLLNQARPLEIRDEAPGGTRVTALLMTHERVWTETFGDIRSVRRPQPPEDSSAIGQLQTAYASERPSEGGRHGETMRAVVIGDSDAFMNQHIESNGGAASFFLNSIAWLPERREMLYIKPRVFESTPVTLNKSQYWTLFGLFMAFGAAFTLGGTAWALARRRMK